jgi:hypothetical protein
MHHINRRTFIQGSICTSLTALLYRGGWEGQAIAQSAFAPFLLHIHASGGWDTTMVFDNKIGKGGVTTEPGAISATGAGNIRYVDHSNRPAVKAFFDAYGGNTAIVNGINTGGINRNHALKVMMGAIPTNRFRYSDWISFYTYSTNPVMPLPHVVIDAPWMPGDYSSIATQLPSSMIDTYVSGVNGNLDTKAESSLATFRSAAFTKVLTKANPKSLDADKLNALAHSYARNAILYTETKKAVTTMGDTSGDPAFVRNGKLAVEFFAQGSSQAVTLQSGIDNEWDTTSDNFNLQSEKFEALFSGISSILAYASTRGVGSKMLVIVTSERGRSPTLNDREGKHAWSFTSALLYGVGIKGGTTVGITDDFLRGMPIDPIFGSLANNASPLEMGNVMAAIYLKTNVPSKIMLPNHSPLSPIILAEE